MAARLRLVVVGLLLTTLTSCIARSGVAVSGADQTVVLHLARCDVGELVTEVRLATAGRNKIPDDSDDHVLWQARAEGPRASIDEIIVGAAPAGMLQSVPLVEPLQGGQEYYGLIDSGGRSTTDFKPDQLRPDGVLYDGRHQTLEAFEKAARSGGRCATGGSNWEIVVRTAALLAVFGVAAGLIFFWARRRRRQTGAAP